MGAPMARRLLSAGFSLTVYNRTAAKSEALASAGARVASTPRDAARDADVVCTMLADPAALHAVFEGPEGVLEGVREGAVVVELSTVGVEPLVSLRAALLARGVSLVDAPVSGSRRPAEEGALVLLVGGPSDAVSRVEPVLSTWGSVHRTGGPGTGAATKLVFNQLGAHMMAGLAGGMVLGAKLGLDPRALLSSIELGAFRSPLFAQKGARIAEGRFEPADFTVELLRKDQDLVLAAARACGVELPTLESVRTLIDRSVREGDGARDLCAIVRVLERSAGVVARSPLRAGTSAGADPRCESRVEE